MRPFSKWAGEEIEKVCARNDRSRPGNPPKLPWETAAPKDLYRKIDEEVLEMIEAYMVWRDYPTDRNRSELAWECADVAATAMMLSARLDPIMQGLRRGKIRGRQWNEQKKPDAYT